MKKFIPLCCLLFFVSCKTYFFSEHSDKPGNFIVNEKLFSEVENMLVQENIPSSLIMDKVYLQAIYHPDEPDKSELFYYTKYYNLEMKENQVLGFDEHFKNSMSKFTNLSEINLTWTNRVRFPLDLAFKYFDPKEVKLENLLQVSKPKDGETVLLPLVCYFDDKKHNFYYHHEDTYMLILAFYIFDQNQIYYAKSVSLSKYNFIKNSENPKDTQFLQSEWDYLVYEALRPLLEKGVELEIRSKGPLTSDAGTD